ncbi:MAG TPA: baseplate J/gp47 family protein [Candidatus Levilactobacillus faecigallinarum]|uniref:Baseplate J/gp47 family protein n=1 Tax=Candidatus Levilactobacillus faecigallinarum TaxID=2838638 RepID=A0A9D1U3W7_9LACO|nr:baseplate J/gp47 family protein [Candidatus Levilactobacillus faecigallinarum]
MPMTLTGFEPKTYEEWLLAIQTELQKDENLGPNVDMSTGSYVETFAESLARQLAESDLTKQDLYDSRFVLLAEGVQLDRLASNVGISRNASAYATTKLLIKGVAGYVVDAETMFSNNQDRYYLTEEEVTIGLDGTATVKVDAEETGEEYNCDANTITDQVTYVEEITDVTNPAAAGGGADMETDYSLRRRVLMTQNAIKSPTPNGITTALFEVIGVRSVRHIVNANPPSVPGDPAYTTHLYVLGGDEQAVAQTISDNIALGITLTGDQKYNIPLDNGDVNHVAFSVGSTQQIYMKLSVDLGDIGEMTTDEVIQDVRDSIQAWMDEFNMGDKLKYTQLFGVIYDVEAVSNVTDLEWGTSEDSLKRSDIQLDNFAIGDTSDDAIEVTING